MIIGFSRFCVTVSFVGMGFDCQRGMRNRDRLILKEDFSRFYMTLSTWGLVTSFDDVGRKRALVTKARPKVEGAD